MVVHVDSGGHCIDISYKALELQVWVVPLCDNGNAIASRN
jgi:hypothetical protein